MPTDHRAVLAGIKRFDQLIAYLRDEMGWPISRDSFDEDDDLYYEYTPEELGIDPKTAVKIESIKRLRPLSPQQPWGIFFIKFEPKKLPVVALRRILSQVALKKRASANKSERVAWSVDDLLFISNYGEGAERQISFAHFSHAEERNDLPTLRVLGWDDRDTPLHLDAVAQELTEQLAWPDDDRNTDAWRERWRSAFALKHGEVIHTSKQLSIRLAELARSIHDRIKSALAIETERGPLTKLMKAFQESLVHDLNPDSFADMYAQTIAYGLLSARIADPQRKTADDFAAHMRTNPFLKELMQTFLHVGGRRGKAGGTGIDFDELGVNDVVALLDNANMEAVVRDFGDRNPQEDPVIHFYELFLKEYDAKKRMQRGVFYTPRPVVSYIVRSVDELLRTEFGLEDGLADTTTWGEMITRNPGLSLPVIERRDPANPDSKDVLLSPDEPFVQILDPATGTGTFLVEAIDVIHKTLERKWQQEGQGRERIVDSWNEYVPQHLLPRLHGYELLMAPYAIAHLKIGLKLFETGYRFESDERARVYLTNALEPASDKQYRLDLLPALAHEAAATNEVKRHKRFTVVMGNPPYAGHSVNNQLPWIVDKVHDYKRGLPDLQRPGQAKWLQDDYVKFLRFAEVVLDQSATGVVGMITNHSFLDNPTFRGLRRSLINSFSDLRFLDLHGNTKSREKTDAVSEDQNVFDIQQGVGISLLTAGFGESGARYGELWGSRESKYSALQKSNVRSSSFEKLIPVPEYYLFIRQDADLRTEYERGISIHKAMGENGDPAPGIVTTQDEFAIAFTESEMRDHIAALLGTQTEKEARELFRLCTQSQWNYANAKRELKKGDWVDEIEPILYRPFDMRWTVFNQHVAVHRRLRVMRLLRAWSNLALVTTRSVEIGRGFEHVFCTRGLIQHHTVSLKEVNFVFPLYLRPDAEDLGFDKDEKVNFSPGFLSRLSISLTIPQGTNGIPFGLTPEDIFHYAYAVLHSPSYRIRYAEFLKIDFPRLPLTGDLELFRGLARLGGELTALHLLESPKLSKPITAFTGGKNPEIEKISYSNNTVWVDKSQTVCFKGVPEDVWNFHIGGYQVCEKWLKDRKGRKLSKEDIEHYQKIVVALNETIRLMKEIDEVIEAQGGWPGAFATGATTTYEEPPSPFLKAATPVSMQTEEEPETASNVDDDREPPVTLFEQAPRTKQGKLFDAPESERRSIFDFDRPEVMAMIREVMTEAGKEGLTRAELIYEVAHRLGFARVGSRVHDSIDGDIRAATRRGIVMTNGGRIYVDCRVITDYPRNLLQDYLLTVMGSTWWTQTDAIRDTARHLGFRRTGSAITDAFKSAISGLIRQGRIERDGERVRGVKE